jgi:hypothetical protein
MSQTSSSAPQAIAELAQRQAAVVRALGQTGQPPPDFVEADFRVAGQSLARKRLRIVQKLFPQITQSLGERFEAQFIAYTSQNPLPSDGYADGIQLAGWLKSRRLFPCSDQAQLEYAMAKVNQGFPIRLVYLKNPRRFVVIFRLGRSTRMWSSPCLSR